MRRSMEASRSSQTAGRRWAFGVPLVSSAVLAGEIAPGEPK
jgi:hypothetical protein